VATTTKTTVQPQPTGPAKPSPTQPGLTESCTSFYKAAVGDTCDSIRAKFGTFTLQEFISWNPAVGEECRGLWADTYYCVGIPGTPTQVSSSSSSTTTAASTTGTVLPKPSPTQPGLIDSCVTFYKAIGGDSCTSIISKHGNVFSMSQFVSWNPAVGQDCRGLWADTYYCVGVPGTPTPGVSTVTTTLTTMTTTKPGNGIATPTPIRPGMINDCSDFYLVQPDQGCWEIARKHGITETLLQTWNPAIGDDCSGLWANVYVCVGKIGFVPPTRIACHTGTNTKTWGDNYRSAVESFHLWCEGTGATGGSGPLAANSAKKACYKAKFGVNKLQFEIVNQRGALQTLSQPLCRQLFQLSTDVCERGGVITTDDWQMK
jgi:LysM domain